MFVYSRFIIHVMIPLITGGCIYIFFRSLDLRMFEWFNIIGITEVIFNFRDIVQSNINLRPWMIFSLPDGLWTYSFTSSMILVWRNNDKYSKIFICSPLVISILFEFLQYFEIINGTFDWNDVYIIIVSFLICNTYLNLKLHET